MTAQPMVCERCGEQLARSYSTEAFSATGQSLQVAPDGVGALFQRGGFVACSWNCIAVLAALRAGATGDAVVRMVAERERQVTTEGWTPEHDASLPPGDLAQAGVLYALNRSVWPETLDDHNPDAKEPPTMWPWDPEWWKPKSTERDLIRAGALIAAEADRDHGRRPPAPKGEPF